LTKSILSNIQDLVIALSNDILYFCDNYDIPNFTQYEMYYLISLFIYKLIQIFNNIFCKDKHELVSLYHKLGIYYKNNKDCDKRLKPNITQKYKTIK